MGEVTGHGGNLLGGIWTIWAVVGFVLALTGLIPWWAYITVTTVWWLGMALIGI
jgi:hypothetical protein